MGSKEQLDDKYLDPEALKKRASRQARKQARQAKREAAELAKPVKPITELLRSLGNCGLVTIGQSVPDEFRSGFEATYGKDGVLYLPAAGNIEGENLGTDHALEVTSAMGKVWNARNKRGSLIVISDATFGFATGADAGTGTPEVFDQFATILHRQTEQRVLDSDPKILIVGDGTASDLPTSGADYNKYQQYGITSALAGRIALIEGQKGLELTTYVETSSVG